MAAITTRIATPQLPRLLVVGTGALVAAGLAGFAIGAAGTTELPLLASLLTIVACLTIAFVSPPVAMVALMLAGRYDLGPLVRGVLDIALWSLLGLVLAAFVSHGAREIHVSLRHPIIIRFFVFVSLVTLSYAEMRFSAYAAEKTFRVLVYGTAFVVVPLVYLRSKEHIVKFFAVLIGSINLLGLISLLSTLRTTDLLQIRRIAPPGGGPITLARYLGFGAILCVGLALYHQRHRRLLLANGFALTVLSFLTGSRAPAIFLVCVMALMPPLIFLNARTRRHAPRLAMAFVALALLVLPAWQYAAERDAPFVSRFELLTEEDRGTSFVGRENRFRTAIAVAHESPWTGVGVGGWALEVEGVDERAYPHNIFLETLVEQGLIGLASLAAYVVAVLLTGSRHLLMRSTTPPSVILSLIALQGFVYSLLIAQTSGDLYDNRFLWFFGTLVLICSQLDRSPKPAT